MIFYDLDGVLRDLCGHIRPTSIVRNWNDKINGIPLMDYVNDNLGVLTKSPKTEYFDEVFKQKTVSIISVQPKEWRAGTYKWIQKHFKGHEGELGVRYVDNGNEKLDIIGTYDYIVEDSPNLKNYSKVILISYPYNAHIKGAAARVESKKDLAEILKYGILVAKKRKEDRDKGITINEEVEVDDGI